MKNYNLKSLVTFSVISAINYAYADTASIPVTMGLLQNEWIKAGVNANVGTLGSGGGTSPGLLFDPSHTGTFNVGYDYLTPGTPFDGFSLKVGATNKTNNNTGSEGIAGQGLSLSNSNQTLSWSGSATYGSSVWLLTNAYTLTPNTPYINVTTTITAGSAASNVYFAKFIDPDSQGMAGDSSATDNVLGYGAIPSTNVAFSEATVSRYALGLYSAATNVTAGINNWNTDAASYNGTIYPGGALYGRSDDTIGLSFYWTSVVSGDILTASYAYIFGPSAFSASSEAVAGGAGGGTPGSVPGGGTLTDVGSATAAASSPTPTVTGTSTATITVSDVTAASSTLPVVTVSLAHHVATDAAGVQTIARETTTNVTTPMERTLVTKVRTTTTWSDSTTTFVDAANTTAITLSNSVETTIQNSSFSGRIDQQSQLSELNRGVNRGLNADAYRKDMVDGERYRMYMGATYLSSNAGNGYDANSNRVNIGVEADINDSWIMGLQYNNVTTKLDGVDSNTKQNKNHAGLYSVMTVNDWIVKSDFGLADNNIKSNRDVEQTFFNASKTNGTDVWLSNRVYMPSIIGLRPYAEFTFGNNERNAYVETGSVQSYRSVSKVNDSINFGEVGARYDKTIDKLSLTGEVGVSTDSYKDLKAELSYLVNPNSRVAWSYSRQEHKDLVSNSIALYGKVNF